jgi:hypothetical protein
VAQALTGAAEAWVKARGMNEIDGPYNYCSTQEMGLLVEGFDAPPALFQTHNMPYYVELLWGLGYRPQFSMQTFTIPRRSLLENAEYVYRKSSRILEKHRARVRRFNKGRFRQDMETLLRLFNESFSGNPEVLPIEPDVFQFQAASLKPFLDPRLVSFIELDGRPVAFALAMPDLNELLQRLNGKLSLFAVLAQRRLLRQVRSAIVLLIGAIPDLHGMGLGRALVAELVRGLVDGGYESVHTTWIHERNWTSRVLAHAFEIKCQKRYAIFGRSI